MTRPDGEVVSAIAYSVGRLREEIPPDLADLLADDVVLVPTPGSAPLPPKQPNALWIARRICQELSRAGFGARWEPLLVRAVAVPKSSTAAQEGRERTNLQAHYDSFAVSPQLGAAPKRITLVDDFITKGNTLLAGAARLRENYPHAQVRAFALVRTQYEIASGRSGGNVFRAIVDPVVSYITEGNWGAWRHDE